MLIKYLQYSIWYRQVRLTLWTVLWILSNVNHRIPAEPFLYFSRLLSSFRLFSNYLLRVLTLYTGTTGLINHSLGQLTYLDY